MNYKAELLKSLGLPETATDEEIAAKLAVPAPDITSLNREITTLRDELKTHRDAAVEADLDRFAPVIEDQDAARQLLQLNRDATVKVFAGMMEKRGGTPAQPVYQKNRSTPPDGAQHFAEGAAQDAAATAKFRAVEARAAALVAERKIPFGQAFEMAKAEAESTK